jgi:peptidoglycan/LPS O-acetylase OafA/YrhL
MLYLEGEEILGLLEIEQLGSVSPNNSPIQLPETNPLSMQKIERRLVHVRELDGVRGIAALAVFLHHICFTSISSQGWPSGIRFISEVSVYGAYGVDLFFVLSGFLITSLLIEDRERPDYYQPFYWKRALRIMPLYFLCLIGVLVLYQHSGRYVLLSALFIANFAWIFHVPSFGPFWTLAIEEQFYLIWPTVVRHRSIKLISYWAIGIGLGAALLRLIAACFGHHNYYFTFFRCDSLAMGAWIACCFERWGRLKYQSTREKNGWTAAFISGVILVGGSLPPRSGSVAIALSAACSQAGVTLICGSVIAFLIAHRQASYLAIFRSRILTFFGLISYALYMTHLYVMSTYDRLGRPLRAGDVQGYVLRFFCILFITMVICLVSRYLIELPASSLRKYVLKTPRHAEGSTASANAVIGT